MAYPDLARRLKFLASTTRRHGLGHFVEIIRQRRARARFAQHPPLIPAPTELARRLRGTDDSAAWLERWRAAVRLPHPSLLDEKLRTHPKHDAVIAAAEGIAAGRFTALGVSLVEPAGTFHWHRDYTSGRLWPYTPHDTIRFIGDDGSDVKYPWELNRMYQLGWLGLAWRATGERRWVDAFRRLVDDWREWNEPWRGVNWAMPMEVGIRAVWLVLAAGLFADATELDPDWWMRYEQLVWAHGRYLASNFEYFANLTNHYVANCLGLLAVGSIMPQESAEHMWFDEGRHRLLRELERQVHPDGVHYELSIGYHRLVLEMMLLGAHFAERGGTPFDDSALKHLERMAEFVHDYTPGHGSAPQLGDSDDGLILRLEPERDLYDHRDTLSLAGALLGRDDLLAHSGEESLAALLLAPGKSASHTPPSALESRLYRNGGFAVLRSDALHVLADVGEIGLHGNNDTLAFTLSSHRTAWIVDPGTYCYTRDPDLRNLLRSTARHNAPAVDGAETAPFSGLWRVRYDRTGTTVDLWSPESGTLAAHHNAYSDRGMEVKRRWQLAGETLEVHDTLSGSGTHSWSCCFTVPEEIEVVRCDERSVELRGDGETMVMECSHSLEIEAGWYSTGYGVARSATLLRTGSASVGLPVEVSYLWRLPGREG